MRGGGGPDCSPGGWVRVRGGGGPKTFGANRGRGLPPGGRGLRNALAHTHTTHNMCAHNTRHTTHTTYNIRTLGFFLKPLWGEGGTPFIHPAWRGTPPAGDPPKIRFLNFKKKTPLRHTTHTQHTWTCPSWCGGGTAARGPPAAPASARGTPSARYAAGGGSRSGGTLRGTASRGGGQSAGEGNEGQNSGNYCGVRIRKPFVKQPPRWLELACQQAPHFFESATGCA